MSELKPCPFCGSKAGLYWDEYRGDYKSPHATVDCLSDDCSASIELDDETIDSAKERVTAAWNSRAAQITPVWQPIETAPSKELVFAISEGDEIEMVLGETVSSAHYDDGEPLYLGWLPREALPPPPDSPGTTGGS